MALALVLALFAAGGAAAATKPSCRGVRLTAGLGEPQPPAELEGSLEASVLAQYGVFRRAQVAGDELPPVNPAAETIGHSLSGYYPSEIRLLAALPSGERFYVVPGLPRAISVARPDCLPKALREDLERQKAKAAEPRYCVVATAASAELGGEACTPFGEVGSSTPLFSLFGAEAPTALLVPDGVATVRVVGPGTKTVTVAVSENAYVYMPPPGLEKEEGALFKKLVKKPKGKHLSKAQKRRLLKKVIEAFETIVARTRPSRVEWVGPTGAVLKTIKRPPGLGPSGGLVSLFAALLTIS